jgi:hypothetical protein
MGSNRSLRSFVGLITQVAALLVPAMAASAAVYWFVVRPWHLRWMASEEEARLPMPGDDLVPRPTIALTRAATIEAPPAAVWPWLIQMGYRRAGWYSYDFFDNDGVHVDRILPEHQVLKVGDVMHTDEKRGFRVERIEPERLIVAIIRGQETGAPGDIAIAMLLEPLGPNGQQTRLLVRLRARFWGFGGWLFALLFDFGDFVFMRKMILGIKGRAENAWLSVPTHPATNGR